MSILATPPRRMWQVNWSHYLPGCVRVRVIGRIYPESYLRVALEQGAAITFTKHLLKLNLVSHCLGQYLYFYNQNKGKMMFIYMKVLTQFHGMVT